MVLIQAVISFLGKDIKLIIEQNHVLCLLLLIIFLCKTNFLKNK